MTIGGEDDVFAELGDSEAALAVRRERKWQWRSLFDHGFGTVAKGEGGEGDFARNFVDGQLVPTGCDVALDCGAEGNEFFRVWQRNYVLVFSLHDFLKK